ncbi:MAG: hypothetical protein OHK0022_00750 [Roseiflexaceae bacterium]
MSEVMQIVRFSDIDINDPFFDSLKESYTEFENWFNRKAQERAHIMVDGHGSIIAFLYLKREFTYNAAFQKRITRGTLLDEVGLSADAYWGFMHLSDEQFRHIIQLGGIDESLVID